MKKIKSFALTEEEIYIIEKESKRLSISQSEFISKLLKHSKSGYEKEKLKQIESLFSKILQMYKNLEKQNLLLLKGFKYFIQSDSKTFEKICIKCKENGDFDLLEFLIKGKI